MDAKRYVRVVVRAADPRHLVRFFRGRSLDLGCGRPRQHRDGWRMDFYCPADEAKDFAADGCSFHVDHGFFERLSKARQEEDKRRPTLEALKAALERGEWPTTQRGKFPPTPVGKPR